MLILDTNVVCYVMNRHPLAELYAPHFEGHTLAISFMTVGEVLEGALRANWGEQRMQSLEKIFQRYLIIESNHRLCRRWAQVRNARRQQPISPPDAWIAATALEFSCPLVTHNRKDFHGIPNLTVIGA